MHDALRVRYALHFPDDPGNMTPRLPAVLSRHRSGRYFWTMELINGIDALRWAKEISKLPDGCFTIAFFPYSRKKGVSSYRLKTLSGCKYRTQLPDERFSIDSDNLFLFYDAEGSPKCCYRILIRYMGFPQDNFKLKRITWL